MDNQCWFVLHTKPRKENQVHRQLRAKAIEVFYPTLKVKPVNPRSAKVRPYFPGYLFVRPDLGEAVLFKIQWLPGVNRLLQFGEEPAYVPDRVVVELKKQILAIQKTGSSNLNGLKKGDLVRVTQGPLAGYEALFDMKLSGKDRVQVLLQLVNQVVKASVDANDIKKI